MGKLLLLTLDEQEEKVIDKIITALADCIPIEAVQVAPDPYYPFRGLKYCNISGVCFVAV